MDIETLDQIANDQLDLMGAVDTSLNRYDLVLKKLKKHSGVIATVLQQIYAYNPEARVQLDPLFETYNSLFGELREALVNYNEHCSKMMKFWQEILEKEAEFLEEIKNKR